MDVARLMITVRGTNRASVITGSSTHNHRIERMWRDVRRVVVRQFQNLFNYMESYGLLDPLDDAHLFALHYVFIPRVNRALAEFQRQHNHHPLRTEHHMTPMQLFMTSPSVVNPVTVDPNLYGVDEDGPVPDVSDSDNAVVVEPLSIALSPRTEAAVILIDPLANDNYFGIELYLSVLALVCDNSNGIVHVL